MEVFMDTGNLQVPHDIVALVAELEHWIKAAIAPGVSDAYSLLEDAINVQLQALGWGAVLNAENGGWVPIPAGYTIINNPPDPHFYPQRCYQVPEGPAQWRTLWIDNCEVHFLTWHEAYTFVFMHLAQEQAQLPRKRYCVRPPKTWGGNDYVATSADHAVHLHLHYWLSLGWITTQRAGELQFDVFEHCGDRGFFCNACQHAPCKYTPAEKWPLPDQPGYVAASLGKDEAVAYLRQQLPYGVAHQLTFQYSNPHYHIDQRILTGRAYATYPGQDDGFMVVATLFEPDDLRAYVPVSDIVAIFLHQRPGIQG
jgi:hypothetical protein